MACRTSYLHCRMSPGEIARLDALGLALGLTERSTLVRYLLKMGEDEARRSRPKKLQDSSDKGVDVGNTPA